jgi:phosphopantetheine--protein transferase-like protein
MNRAMSGIPPLEQHRAVVLLCPYPQLWSDAELDRQLEQLPAVDRTRAEQFKHLGARNQFIVARTLLYQYLKGLFAPDEFPPSLSRNEFGRLFLADNHVDFNISHTEGLVGITFSASASVGLDVETSQRKGSHLDIADRFFHPIEVAQITAGRNEIEQTELFFRHWTMKEAYVKAIGNGLRKSLQSFYVEFCEPKALRFFDREFKSDYSIASGFSGRWGEHFHIGWTKLGADFGEQTPTFYLIDRDYSATEVAIEPLYQAQNTPLQQLT